MKRVLLSVFQVALFGAMFIAFFAMTPWLGCRPLAEFDTSAHLEMQIPSDAVCFTNNHGQIAFHSHGLISEEPVRFALHLAALIVPFAILIGSFWMSGDLRKFFSQSSTK